MRLNLNECLIHVLTRGGAHSKEEGLLLGSQVRGIIAVFELVLTLCGAHSQEEGLMTGFRS